MSKISNVRLPNPYSPEYDPQLYNQLVRSLEQVILQLNTSYTPTATQNLASAENWFESIGPGDSMDGSTSYINGTSFDAFGRLRASNPFTLFDSKNRFQKDPQFDESLAGNAEATYDQYEASVDLTVTTATDDEAIRQTYRSFPYQPGKSLLVLATFVMAPDADDLVQRVGYFNAGNGVFFQKSGSTVSFVIRTSTSGSPSDVRKVDQADWNGDPLNGSGPSGLTLDTTKAQILYMDFEWLGVGSVRCGFVIEGTFIVCHTFHNANSLDKVYMTTATLPVRYEIKNTGSSEGTLKQICSTVISEGGYQQKSKLIWARRTSAPTVTTSFYPLVSVRLKSSSSGAVVMPSAFNALPIGSNLDYEIALIKNPTLTGASYTDLSTNLEYDTTATALSGGTIVDLTYTAASNQGIANVSGVNEYNFDLQFGNAIDGTSDVYTLAARTISGSNSVIGALSLYDLTD